MYSKENIVLGCVLRGFMRSFLFLLLFFWFTPPVLAQDADWREALTPQDEIDFPALQDEDSEESGLPKVEAQAVPLAMPEEPELSTLEAMYAERVEGEPPLQFGYAIFENTEPQTQSPMGAVQDDYILGVGDEVSVSFSGQRNTRETAKVDAQGLVVIEDFAPITAVGLSLAQFRAALEERSLGLHNTQVYVTLANMRQIGILVVGNVKKPGRQSATVFHTVLDALMQAGAVKRPGIFEIRTDPFKGLMGKNTNKLTLRQMVQLGGGVLSAGQNRFMHLAVRENGYEVVEEVTEEGVALFGDGAVLMVSRGKELRAAKIELLGQTRKAGLYALAKQKTLSAVLNDPQVLGGGYLSVDRGDCAVEPREFIDAIFRLSSPRRIEKRNGYRFKGW